MIRGRQKLDVRIPSPEFLDEMARVFWHESQQSRDPGYHMAVARHLEQRAIHDRKRMR